MTLISISGELYWTVALCITVLTYMISWAFTFYALNWSESKSNFDAEFAAGMFLAAPIGSSLFGLMWPIITALILIAAIIGLPTVGLGYVIAALIGKPTKHHREKKKIQAHHNATIELHSMENLGVDLDGNSVTSVDIIKQIEKVSSLA